MSISEKIIAESKSNLLIGCKVIVELNSLSKQNDAVSFDQKNTSWLIFEDGKNTNSTLTRTEVFKLLIYFLVSLSKTLFKKPADIPYSDWIGALSSNLTWCLSCYWSDKIALEKFTTNFLKTRYISHIHCVHEFHPHSKILWKICSTNKIKCSSIEHASNEREKLWLFPTQQEVMNNHPLPSLLFVYNEKHKQWWHDIFDDLVNFQIACGPRFAKWKCSNNLLPYKSNKVLLVTSQSWWDNEVIFQTIEKLLDSNFELTIRLHPHSQLKKWQKKWLSNKLKNTRIEVDNSPLEKSISNHSIILGMCSTVLDEALLMGRCSIKVEHDEFSSLGSSLSFSININDISEESINSIFSTYEDRRVELIKISRSSFGLEHAEASFCQHSSK